MAILSAKEDCRTNARNDSENPPTKTNQSAMSLSIFRHCEERSDEAILSIRKRLLHPLWGGGKDGRTQEGLPRFEKKLTTGH